MTSVTESYEETLKLLRTTMKSELKSHKKKTLIMTINEVISKVESGESGSLTIGFMEGTVTQIERRNILKLRNQQ